MSVQLSPRSRATIGPPAGGAQNRLAKLIEALRSKEETILSLQQQHAQERMRAAETAMSDAAQRDKFRQQLTEATAHLKGLLEKEELEKDHLMKELTVEKEHIVEKLRTVQSQLNKSQSTQEQLGIENRTLSQRLEKMAMDNADLRSRLSLATAACADIQGSLKVSDHVRREMLSKLDAEALKVEQLKAERVRWMEEERQAREQARISHERAQEEAQSLLKQIAEKNREIQSAEQRTLVAQERSFHLEKQVEQMDQERLAAKRLAEQIRAEREETVKDLSNEITERKVQGERQKEAILGLEKQVEQRQSAEQRTRTELFETQNRLVEVTAERDALQRRLARLEARLTDVEREREEWKEKEGSARAQVKRAEDQNTELDSQRLMLEQRLRGTRAELEDSGREALRQSARFDTELEGARADWKVEKLKMMAVLTSLSIKLVRSRRESAHTALMTWHLHGGCRQFVDHLTLAQMEKERAQTQLEALRPSNPVRDAQTSPLPSPGRPSPPRSPLLPPRSSIAQTQPPQPYALALRQSALSALGGGMQETGVGGEGSEIRRSLSVPPIQLHVNIHSPSRGNRDREREEEERARVRAMRMREEEEERRREREEAARDAQVQALRVRASTPSHDVVAWAQVAPGEGPLQEGPGQVQQQPRQTQHIHIRSPGRPRDTHADQGAGGGAHSHPPNLTLPPEAERQQQQLRGAPNSPGRVAVGGPEEVRAVVTVSPSRQRQRDELSHRARTPPPPYERERERERGGTTGEDRSPSVHVGLTVRDSRAVEAERGARHQLIPLESVGTQTTGIRLCEQSALEACEQDVERLEALSDAHSKLARVLQERIRRLEGVSSLKNNLIGGLRWRLEEAHREEKLRRTEIRNRLRGAGTSVDDDEIHPADSDLATGAKGASHASVGGRADERPDVRRARETLQWLCVEFRHRICLFLREACEKEGVNVAPGAGQGSRPPAAEGLTEFLRITRGHAGRLLHAVLFLYQKLRLMVGEISPFVLPSHQSLAVRGGGGQRGGGGGDLGDASAELGPLLTGLHLWGVRYLPFYLRPRKARLVEETLARYRTRVTTELAHEAHRLAESRNEEKEERQGGGAGGGRRGGAGRDGSRRRDRDGGGPASARGVRNQAAARAVRLGFQQQQQQQRAGRSLSRERDPAPLSPERQPRALSPSQLTFDVQVPPVPFQFRTSADGGRVGGGSVWSHLKGGERTRMSEQDREELEAWMSYAMDALNVKLPLDAREVPGFIPEVLRARSLAGLPDEDGGSPYWRDQFEALACDALTVYMSKWRT